MTGKTPDFTDPLPSMSTDTTSTNDLIRQVTQGMRVVDSNNEEIGKVEFVAMGDPSAATIDTPQMDDSYGVVTTVAEALGAGGEPDVENRSLRERLLHNGYIKIDGKGWFGADRYAGSDQITSVSDNTVQLRATKDELVSS